MYNSQFGSPKKHERAAAHEQHMYKALAVNLSPNPGYTEHPTCSVSVCVRVYMNLVRSLPELSNVGF